MGVIKLNFDQVSEVHFPSITQSTLDTLEKDSVRCLNSKFLLSEEEAIQLLAFAARVCYKSDKVDKNPLPLISHLANNRHHSVFEHVNFPFYLWADTYDEFLSLLIEIERVDRFSFYRFSDKTVLVVCNLRSILELYEYYKYYKTHTNNIRYHEIIHGILNAVRKTWPKLFETIFDDSFILNNGILPIKDLNINIPQMIKKKNTRYVFHILCTRAIANQIERHRTLSFSQECIVGNSIITPDGMTIRDLWNIQKSGRNISKIQLFSASDQRIVPNYAIKVFKKEFPQLVYKVSLLESKNNLFGTVYHKFMTGNGKYTPIEFLTAGDTVAIKGTDGSFRYDVVKSIERSGSEDVFDLEMASPNPNYVANGIVVHNSSRYINYSKGNSDLTVYIGDGIKDRELYTNYLQEVGEYSMSKYQEAIDNGLKPENARDLLPLGTKTEIVVSGMYNPSIPNFLFTGFAKFFDTRIDNHAQPDIRLIANKVIEYIRIGQRSDD